MQAYYIKYIKYILIISKLNNYIYRTLESARKLHVDIKNYLQQIKDVSVSGSLMANTFKSLALGGDPPAMHMIADHYIQGASCVL